MTADLRDRSDKIRRMDNPPRGWRAAEPAPNPRAASWLQAERRGPARARPAQASTGSARPTEPRPREPLPRRPPALPHLGCPAGGEAQASAAASPPPGLVGASLCSRSSLASAARLGGREGRGGGSRALLPTGLRGVAAAPCPRRWRPGPSPPTGAGGGWWCSPRSSSRPWCSGCSAPSASSSWSWWRRLKSRRRGSPGSPP